MGQLGAEDGEMFQLNLANYINFFGPNHICPLLYYRTFYKTKRPLWITLILVFPVEIFVNFPKLTIGNMSIDLSGSDIGMTQHQLDRTNISTIL